MLAEFSLLAVERTKVQEAADERRLGSKSALDALRTLSFQLSGAQLGITITSLIVGFLAEPAIAEVIRPALEAAGAPAGSSVGISVALALTIATAAQMVFGELIPKNYAIARPVRTALFAAPVLRVYNRAFKPLTLFLNGAANATVRLLGIEPQEELQHVRSLEELQLIIHSSRQEGTLPEEEFALLARSLSFGEKTAADALIPRTSIVAINKDHPISDLVTLALDTGYTRFPVYGENLDDIAGVANIKETYRIPPQERSSTPVSEITGDALIVPESRDLEDLLFDMRRQRRHLAVVIDEFGGTAGIVSLEDLIEEIVGEIEDEYDRVTADLRAAPEGIHVVSGMLHADEVRAETGFDMPEGDYETLAGFLLLLFDRIPAKGDQVSYGGWELKVVNMQGRRIDRVLMVAPPQPGPLGDAG